jgi:hypothetical protein
MASNLLIGYPDIPYRATAITTTGTENTAFPLSNSISGARDDRVELAATANLPYIQFDLGASVTASVNYFFIARANLLKSALATQAILLRYDGASEVSVLGTGSGLQTRTFTGPNSEDLMFASGFNDQVVATIPSSSYRYWRFYFGDSVLLKKWTFGKAYFGTLFDIGRNPVYGLVAQPKVRRPGNRRPAYTFDVRWEGITDANRALFISTIASVADISPVVLWDTSDYALNGMRTLHAKMIEHEIIPTAYNTTTITAKFQEMI